MLVAGKHLVKACTGVHVRFAVRAEDAGGADVRGAHAGVPWADVLVREVAVREHPEPPPYLTDAAFRWLRTTDTTCCVTSTGPCIALSTYSSGNVKACNNSTNRVATCKAVLAVRSTYAKCASLRCVAISHQPLVVDGCS